MFLYKSRCKSQVAMAAQQVCSCEVTLVSPSILPLRIMPWSAMYLTKKFVSSMVLNTNPQCKHQHHKFAFELDVCNVQLCFLTAI